MSISDSLRSDLESEMKPGRNAMNPWFRVQLKKELGFKVTYHDHAITKSDEKRLSDVASGKVKRRIIDMTNFRPKSSHEYDFHVESIVRSVMDTMYTPPYILGNDEMQELLSKINDLDRNHSSRNALLLALYPTQLFDADSTPSVVDAKQTHEKIIDSSADSTFIRSITRNFGGRILMTQEDDVKLATCLMELLSSFNEGIFDEHVRHIYQLMRVVK